MEVIADSISTIVMIVAIILMGMITYRESEKEIKSLKRSLADIHEKMGQNHQMTYRVRDELTSRIKFLEWRINHPEIQFIESIGEGPIYVKYKSKVVAKITPVFNAFTGEVTKTEVQVWEGSELTFENLTEIKNSFELYGAQLFK